MATATKRRATANAGQPRVFSYIRFSTPEQGEGDSERRQIERADQWAKRHGYILDDSLRADRGRSGYSGAHRTKGNLGKFLARVEAGEVPRGSILVVEELRRLTREGVYVGLKETIFKLFDAGITLQTLAPTEIAYNTETMNRIEVSMTLTLLLQIAHEESRQKSDWAQVTWDHRRNDARSDGKMLTSMAPSWFQFQMNSNGVRKLVLDSNGKPIPEPDAAKSIQMAFEWKEQGLGYQTITRRLNAEAPWSPVVGWKISYVKKVIRNRAVIGEHQPHRRVNGERIPEGKPIEDYFPAIVDPGLFHRVQRMLKKSRGKSAGGRIGNFSNVFTGLVKCAYCGGALHFRPDGHGRHYLLCNNKASGNRTTTARKKKCTASQIPYKLCETAVLTRCLCLRPEDVLPNKAEQTKLCESLRQKVGRIEATWQEIQDQIDNYNRMIGRTKDSQQQDVYEAQVIKLRTELSDSVQKLNAARHELEQAERAQQSFRQRQADLAELFKQIDNDVEVRQRVNNQLHEFVDRIEVFTNGQPGSYNADDFADYLAAAEMEAGVRFKSVATRNRFVAWVERQRRSIAGRFLRVHFTWPSRPLKDTLAKPKRGKRKAKAKNQPTANAWIDVVPDGSIAGSPAIKPLLEKFVSSKKRPTV